MPLTSILLDKSDSEHERPDRPGLLVQSARRGLPESGAPLTLNRVKTLTVEEATTGLGKWLELTVAGEGIRIRKGDALVELRPVTEKDGTAPREQLAPREGPRQLQGEAHLSPEQARRYLQELREERLASETRRSA